PTFWGIRASGPAHIVAVPRDVPEFLFNRSKGNLVAFRLALPAAPVSELIEDRACIMSSVSLVPRHCYIRWPGHISKPTRGLHVMKNNRRRVRPRGRSCHRRPASQPECNYVGGTPPR